MIKIECKDCKKPIICEFHKTHLESARFWYDGVCEDCNLLIEFVAIEDYDDPIIIKDVEWSVYETWCDDCGELVDECECAA